MKERGAADIHYDALKEERKARDASVRGRRKKRQMYVIEMKWTEY